MRNICFLAILCLVFGKLQAQAPVNLESKEIEKRAFKESFIPKITGKLQNFSKQENPKLSISYVIVGLGARSQETKTAQIDDAGNFTLSLTNGLPYQQIWLSIGEHYYGKILANKELKITVDLELLKKNPFTFYGEGINFSGADGELNTLINQRKIYKSEETQNLQEQKQRLTLNPGGDIYAKTKKTREIYDSFAALDKAFIKEHPSDYDWVFENERLSDFYADIFVIHWGKGISPELMQEALDHKPALVSNASYSYYSYLSSLLSYPPPGESAKIIERVLADQIDDSAQGQELTSFITEYKKKSNNDFFNERKYKAGLKFFKVFEKELQEARNKLYLEQVSQLPQKTSDLVKVMGQPEDLYAREIYVEKVLALTKTKWCADLMRKTLKKDRSKIAAIESSLKNISNLDENHTLGENILNPNENTHLYVSQEDDVSKVIASIQNTYADKTLILDVWATWCAPCISDMQQSGPIKEELKNLPVEVVYVCVATGSNLEKWKKKVLELELSGTHIFLNPKLSNEFMEQFNLQGFPSYLFIDQDRNIDKHFIRGISRIDLEELKKRL